MDNPFYDAISIANNDKTDEMLCKKVTIRDLTLDEPAEKSIMYVRVLTKVNLVTADGPDWEILNLLVEDSNGQ